MNRKAFGASFLYLVDFISCYFIECYLIILSIPQPNWCKTKHIILSFPREGSLGNDIIMLFLPVGKCYETYSSIAKLIVGRNRVHTLVQGIITTLVWPMIWFIFAALSYYCAPMSHTQFSKKNQSQTNVIGYLCIN